MQGIRTLTELEDEELDGKTVLVRVDYNVPLRFNKDGTYTVSNDIRIKDSIPTIDHLTAKKARVVLCSHLGRPKGTRKDEYSLKRVADYINTTHILSGKSIRFCNDCIGVQRNQMVAELNKGEVLLLENVRYYSEEESNVEEFAIKLAENVDIYVNDAFSSSHRAHASVFGVAQIIGQNKFAGFALNKELFFLSKLLIDQPIRPVAAIIGGAKVSTKLGILSHLIDKVDKILIGGGMVFTFYRSIHLSTGDSIVEESLVKDATNIINSVSTKSLVFRMATDCLVASTSYLKAKKSCKSNEELEKLKERHLEAKVVPHDEIPIGWTGLDVGRETINDFITELDSCNTILWNGPLGMIEDEEFASGTRAIAEYLSSRKEKGINTIVCGGETVAFVENLGLLEKFSHVSMGGGASLEFLSGSSLPGVEILRQ